MKKNIILSILFIGLMGVLSSCEKDETKTVMLTNPMAPSIETMPNLTLVRANGNNTLEFRGTSVDPGFNASATYFLEACATGNNFANAVTIKSDVQDTSIKVSISDLNGTLLKLFPADQVSSVDFRIRAVLVVDAGTGALGTGSNPLVYISDPKTANVTIYGLPRLDVISGGVVIGKIESPLGNGVYSGYAKLDKTKPITLKNPDTNVTYGINGGALVVNGTAYTPEDNGWHKLSANTSTLAFTKALFMVGLVGSSTPNQWNGPDQMFDYNYANGLWEITLNLTAGAVKIRANNDWGGGINLGIGDATHPEYTLGNLWNNGSSKDIVIATAGNYTIKVSIGTSTYSATITKNN
jgi:starch-binding outer membrane protein SusE/F